MAEHVETQATFLDTQLKPCLEAAQAGNGHVFFVDAAHFVFGTFLCYLWSFTRIFIRAASGRSHVDLGERVRQMAQDDPSPTVRQLAEFYVNLPAARTDD